MSLVDELAARDGLTAIYIRRGITSNVVICDHLIANGKIKTSITRSAQLRQSRDSIVRAKAAEPEIYSTEERAQAALEEHIDRMELLFHEAMASKDWSAAMSASERKAKACGADVAPPIKIQEVRDASPVNWEDVPLELHRALVASICADDHPEAAALKGSLDARVN